MEKRVYDLTAEPRGRVYRRLIDYALTVCTRFLLVVQGSNLGERGKEVLQDLEPYLRDETRESEWPGTVLSGEGSGATVLRYQFSERSAEILKTAVPRLYAWLEPDLPEDLCLLRPDGSPWLVSISHEHDSSLEMTPNEATELFENVPELARFVEEHQTEPGEASVEQPSAEQLLSVLLEALRDPNRMHEKILAYVRAVRLSPGVIGAEWVDDIFRELASELEWHEPDPEIRFEDPLLQGDAESAEGIRIALARLKDGGFPTT